MYGANCGDLVVGEYLRGYQATFRPEKQCAAVSPVIREVYASKGTRYAVSETFAGGLLRTGFCRNSKHFAFFRMKWFIARRFNHPTLYEISIAEECTMASSAREVYRNYRIHIAIGGSFLLLIEALSFNTNMLNLLKFIPQARRLPPVMTAGNVQMSSLWSNHSLTRKHFVGKISSGGATSRERCV